MADSTKDLEADSTKDLEADSTEDLERGKEFLATRQALFHTFCDFVRSLWRFYNDLRKNSGVYLVHYLSVCWVHGCQSLNTVKIYGSLSWGHAGHFVQQVQSSLRQSFTTCYSFLPDLGKMLMSCILCPFLVVAYVVFTILCFIWSVTESAGRFLQVSFFPFLSSCGHFAQQVRSSLRQSITTCFSFLPDLAKMLMLCILCPFLVVAHVVFTILCFIGSVTESAARFLQVSFFPFLSSCVKPIVLILFSFLSSCVKPIVLILFSGMQYLFFVIFVICYLIWKLLTCVFYMLQALCLISVWCLPLIFVVALISYVAWQHSDMITWLVATSYEAISRMIASIISFFTNTSNPFPSMVTYFKHFLHRIASSMTELVTEVSTFVVNTFTKTIPSFCATAMVFLQSTVTHVIIGISTFFNTGIHSLDTKVMEFLKGMASLVTNLFHKMGIILTDCLFELVNPITVMFIRVWGFFHDLAMAFPRLFSKAMQFIQNMMDAVPNLIFRLGAYLVSPVNEVIKVITSFFHEVGHLLLLPVVAVLHFFQVVASSIGHMFMAIPNIFHEVGHLLLLPVVAVLHFFQIVASSIGHMFMAIPNIFHEVGHLLLLPVVAVLHFFEMVIRSIGHMFTAIPNFFHEVVHLLLLPFVAVLHLFQMVISSIGHMFTAIGALLSKIIMGLCAPFIAVVNFFKSIINLF